MMTCIKNAANVVERGKQSNTLVYNEKYEKNIFIKKSIAQAFCSFFHPLLLVFLCFEVISCRYHISRFRRWPTRKVVEYLCTALKATLFPYIKNS